MNVTPTNLPDVLLIEPRVFGDARGFFYETFNAGGFEAAGLPTRFFQDNCSKSSRKVLRGLHFQNPRAQGKLVWVFEGEVFDVAVDLRRNSPTFGKWTGNILSDENHLQCYVPPGFAHGFCVLSETTLFAYKCTEAYDPTSEGGIVWNDPDVGIKWPIEAPTLSSKDAAYPRLRDLPQDKLF